MTQEEFTKGVGNWDNHRLLLWPALEMTKELGLPVLELGCGDGSSPFLQQYCKDNNLELFSYDYDYNWARKYGATHVTNWETIPWMKEYGVALVDHSPGHHRKEALKKLHHVKIVVLHDSEVPGWNASDYQVRGEIEKYVMYRDLKSEEPQGAWATAMSNFYDLNGMMGL